jgi:hypothetical protein
LLPEVADKLTKNNRSTVVDLEGRIGVKSGFGIPMPECRHEEKVLNLLINSYVPEKALKAWHSALRTISMINIMVQGSPTWIMSSQSRAASFFMAETLL